MSADLQSVCNGRSVPLIVNEICLPLRIAATDTSNPNQELHTRQHQMHLLHKMYALENADSTHPGVNPQPYTGIHFIGIPEWPDLGTQVSQQTSVDEALPATRSTPSCATCRGASVDSRTRWRVVEPSDRRAA
jgi:hypothetical protein